MKRIRAVAFPAGFIFVTIWLSLFAYAGRPLLVAAHAAGLARGAAWAMLIASAFLTLLPLLERRKPIVNWIGYATLALFSSLLVLVALSDVVRLLFLLVRVALPSQAVSFVVIGAALGLSVIGMIQARCPRVKRVSVPIDDLPEELVGYRIAQWSDVHVGPTIQRRFVQSLVDRTNELNVDAIAITGDLVDGHVDDLREQVAPLADLRARDGVFYVTGNHEYYWRASEWAKELTRLGLVFLKNEHRVVHPRLVIAGVTDPASHECDPKAALAGAPDDAIKVLLAHRPQASESASALGVHLQLSGHTHGGQFFPFNLVIKWFQPVVAGLHRIGRTWLYVSRGTGYWGPPSRLGVTGEITVIELRRAAVSAAVGGRPARRR